MNEEGYITPLAASLMLLPQPGCHFSTRTVTDEGFTLMITTWHHKRVVTTHITLTWEQLSHLELAIHAMRMDRLHPTDAGDRVAIDDVEVMFVSATEEPICLGHLEELPDALRRLYEVAPYAEAVTLTCSVCEASA